MHGLRGRRVLVTRSADRAAAMVALLAERGATAVLLPTIRATPVADRVLLHQAIRRVTEYHWLVFTSVTAVHVVFDALAECNALPLPLDLRIAVIGEVTAAAVVHRGAEVHAVAGEYRGEEIGRAIAARAGMHVLFPRSDIARPETVAGLRALGAQVDDVVAYETRFAGPARQRGNLLERVDAITFTSPSTVHGLARAMASEMPRAVGKVIATIGPTTSAAVRDYGLPVHVEPALQTVGWMVNDLDAYFAVMRRHTS